MMIFVYLICIEDNMIKWVPLAFYSNILTSQQCSEDKTFLPDHQCLFSRHFHYYI